jgi:ERCC4-type nuclease
MATTLPTVITDSREQRPWLFPSDRFVTDRRKLVTGDYSLLGYENTFCIERKSLGDFVGTLFGDWIRFRKELIRMSGFDIACIVVECNVEDIRQKKYESEVAPESVLGKAHAIYLDHGLPVYFWGPRIESELMAIQFVAITAKKLGV